MSDHTQQTSVKYKINAVELLNLEMKHPSDSNIDFSAFHFDMKLQHRVNSEKKLVFVITNVTVLSQDKSTQIGSLQTSCIFQVDNFEELMDSEKNVKFPDTFLDEINGMAISTTRGIMYSEFKGTFLHKAVLPVFKSENLRKSGNNE